MAGRRFNQEGVQRGTRKSGRTSTAPAIGKDLVAQMTKAAYVEAKRKGLDAKPKASARSTPLCLNCGRDGHYFLDCKERRSARARVRLPLPSCSSCDLRERSASRSAVAAVVYAYELLVRHGFDRDRASAQNDAEAAEMAAHGGSGPWRDQVREELARAERTHREASEIVNSRARRASTEAA